MCSSRRKRAVAALRSKKRSNATSLMDMALQCLQSCFEHVFCRLITAPGENACLSCSSVILCAVRRQSSSCWVAATALAKRFHIGRPTERIRQESIDGAQNRQFSTPAKQLEHMNGSGVGDATTGRLRRSPAVAQRWWLHRCSDSTWLLSRVPCDCLRVTLERNQARPREFGAARIVSKRGPLERTVRREAHISFLRHSIVTQRQCKEPSTLRNRWV